MVRLITMCFRNSLRFWEINSLHTSSYLRVTLDTTVRFVSKYGWNQNLPLYYMFVLLQRSFTNYVLASVEVTDLAWLLVKQTI